MHQLLRFRYQLNFAEWVIVLAIPLVLIFAIKFVAMFYIGLALILVILAYIVTALFEHVQVKKVNKNRRKHFVKPRFHYGAMLGYGLVSFILSVAYLMR